MHVHSKTNFPQAKLDSEINVRFLLNEHGDLYFLLHNCWRALARQLPILYNREKKAKSVGCKIGDLRSMFALNIRGLLNVETCAVDY